MRGKKLLASLLCTVVTTVSVLAGTVMPVQAADQTLRNTYGNTYGHVGTCINYYQLQNSNTLNQLKAQYNSITLENEMKPDAILGGSAKLISVQEAKNLGYYIPSNYTEQYVPRLNFDTVDKVMKICCDNGIGMRAHTLVWHSQTPSWFFKNGYAANYGYVNQGVMNARLEFYVKSVMNHVYTSQYGKCVYAWDIANEYLHATNSGWEGVYGKCGTRPEFVKRAFQYAYETLEYFKLTNSVSLFYNDFNTYMEVNDVIALVNYINSGKKICNGVGMQSHLGTSFPSVDYYTAALNSFLNAGFEVQITELDVSNSGSAEQARYMYDLMKNVNAAKKRGGRITGITLWGLSDDVSWISDGKNPLIFSRLGVPKESYYKVIQAYNEAGFAGNNNNQQSQPNNQNQNISYATVADGWYYIKNVNANKYLQAANNKGNAGNNVDICSKSNSEGQKWYITNKGNNVITLKNGLGCMLDVTNGSADNGTNIELWNANNKNPQNFMLRAAGNNQYGIVTQVSNGTRGLDAENKGTNDGTNVIQYDFYNGTNQLWVLEKVQENNANNNNNNNGGYATLPDGWYCIKNVNANKYLQSSNNKGDAGNNVDICFATNGNTQKWYLTNKGNNVITLKNGLGCMLDVTNGKNENATNIEVWSENGMSAQNFMLKSAGNNQYGIVTQVSNGTKGLDVANKETKDGANVQQYDFYNGAGQLWIFEKTELTSENKNAVADGWYYIKNLNAQKYLQVAGNQKGRGVNVEIGSGSGVEGQKWYVKNTNDGYVTLKNGQGYMLDIYYGKDEDGTNIRVHDDNGADAQKYKISSLGNNQFAILTKVSQDKRALDVYNFGTNDGANVCQWTYLKNNNQIWYFEPCK